MGRVKPMAPWLAWGRPQFFPRDWAMGDTAREDPPALGAAADWFNVPRAPVFPPGVPSVSLEPLSDAI